MDSSPIYTALVEELRGQPAGVPTSPPASSDTPTISFETADSMMTTPISTEIASNWLATEPRADDELYSAPPNGSGTKDPGS
jgi:hypothetical protein